MLAIFTQGAALGFAAAASPGPFAALLLAQSVRNGPVRTLPLALVPVVSDGPIILLCMLLLTRAPASLLRALQVAGGLFLLWIAFRLLRTADGTAESRPSAEPFGRAFASGVAIAVLSPAPWIYWTLVSGPLLARAWAEAPARGMAFLAGFYLFICGGMAVLILLFGSARSLGPRASRWLSLSSAVVLALFGVRQLWVGLLAS